MFKKLLEISKTTTCRNQCFNTSPVYNGRTIRVAICGAAGNVGRLVSFCLKRCSYNLELSLFDISTNMRSLIEQLNLLNSPVTHMGYMGSLQLKNALKDADIITVLLKNYSSRKTLNEEFDQNFSSIATIAKCCMENNPEAIFAIVTQPLNKIIPAISSLYRYNGIQYDHKIIGVTTMDVINAKSVYANHFNRNFNDVFIPITGGTTADTIVPVFSEAVFVGQEGTTITLNASDSEQLQFNFVKRKNTAKTSELFAAHSIVQFLESLFKALHGEKDVVETAFVAAPEQSPTRYMMSMIDLNEQGIETVYGPLKNVNRFEKRILYPAVLNLQRDIKFGEQNVMCMQKAEFIQSK